MPLNPVRIVKTWFRNNYVEPQHWDELVNKFGTFATETLNNLKQIGLDLGGSTYDFNNVGRATQTSNVISRLNLLENVASVGISNLGLDLSTAGTITLTGGDGTALSSTNTGRVTINDTSNSGQIKEYTLTSSLSLTLTGAHWGLGTLGDFSDVKLYLLFIDDAGSLRFGISADPQGRSVAAANSKTLSTDVSSRSLVLVDTALTGTSNLITGGWLYADFDDTGNAGGEDFWTIQTSQGDIDIGLIHTEFETRSLRF